MKSKWMTLAGYRILYIDLANFKADVAQVDIELKGVLAVLGPEMYQQPEHSVKVLVDLRNTTISPEVLRMIKERIEDSRRYVQRTAVVGLTGIRKAFLDIFAAVARTETQAFEDVDRAQAWLLKESRPS